MPRPRKGDKRSAFIARYMSSAEARKKYPDEKQRYAVAVSVWNKKKK